MNAINWFEIPVNDLERAVQFYTAVLGRDMPRMDLGGLKMALFPADQGEVGGALCMHEDFYKPSSEGTLVYLNGGADLSEPLSRVEAAGGKVVIEKKQINEEVGYMAIFVDTEGNRVAFHSPG